MVVIQNNLYSQTNGGAVKHSINLFAAASLALMSTVPAMAQVTADACVTELGGTVGQNAAGQAVCLVEELPTGTPGSEVLAGATGGATAGAIIGGLLLLAVVVAAGDDDTSGTSGTVVVN
ncbi:hypothetical protein QTA57_03035 [Fontisubflavum oceani]|uniref:hypothetical protein n=1 Tax=Fontisubflavum oceani TaxID=2978973 RepID=UPI0025B52660|nr:hypothetical protein [Fontisubflavum oceani]WJY22161.1 hypothetical protein QTA57_03035 [Fontisubflavum oceani]